MADGYSNDYNSSGFVQGESLGIPTGTTRPYNVPGVMTPDYNAIQDAVRRQQSPYVTMPAHGFLQDRFPGAAGILDNVFLTAANTPGPRGPEGAGGGISRTFQGLMGARQMQMQHGLQQALLPMDIAQRQMAYQQGILNMQKTQAETGYYGAHSRFFDTMGDVRGQMADVAQQRVDQAEEARYGGKLDPASKLAVDGVMRKYGVAKYSDLNADQIAEAQKQARLSKARMGTLSAGDIIAMQMSEDPDEQARGKKASGLYASLFGARTGAQTGAADAANQPKQTAEQFLAAQKTALQTSIGKPPSETEQRDLDQKQKRLAILGKDGYEQIYGPGSSKFDYKTLDQRSAEYKAQAADKSKRWGNYVKSNDWRKGKAFSPDQYGDAPQAAPQAAPIPGAASGQRDPLNLFGPTS